MFFILLLTVLQLTTTGVTATAASCASVTVSRTAATGSSGRSTSQYEAFRDNSSTLIGTVNAPTATFSEPTAKVYSSHTYGVCTKAGNNTPSSIVRTPLCPPPGAPGNLTATTPSCTQLSLRWTAPTQVGAGLLAYRVYRNNTQITLVTGLSYVNGSLTASTSYTYDVSTLDTSGRESAPTEISNYDATELTGGSIRLDWSASSDTQSGLKGYLLYRDDAFLTFAPNGVTSYTDTTGQGTSSTYDIAALDRAGNVTAKVSPNCRFALSANGWTAPSGGGGTSVYVTSSRSVCAWSTSNPYNWLSVTPANGTSSGWVSNGTGSPRSGTVTIGGKSYSVTQSSTICNYSNTTGSSPSAGGTTSGSGTANCGSSVTVSATANAGYTFANWTENGSPVSSSASHTQCEPEFGRQSYRQRQQLHRAEQFFDWHRQLHRLRHFDLRWEILRWLDHNRHWSHRFGKRYGRFLSCRCNPISSHVAARNKSRVKWPDGVERLPGGVQMLMRDEFYVSTVSKKVVRTELQLPEFCPAAVAWRRLSGQMKEYR